MKNNYDHLAEFYDIHFSGLSKQFFDLISKNIRKYHKDCRSILEIACGTGNIIERFPKKYNLAGLDISENMITIARRNAKKARFLVADMKSFSLPDRFDAIFCAHDSINHLKTLRDRKRTFAAVHKNLNPGGLFIFDMNTIR